MLKPRFTYIKFRQEPLNPNNYVLVTGPDEAEIQTMCSLYRAAPDLLVALQTIVKQYRSRYDNFENHFQDAERAIAKATATHTL
jgi:hypothetical protein